MLQSALAVETPTTSNMFYAVKSGNTDAVRLLHQAGATVNPMIKHEYLHLSHQEPLYFATMNNDYEMVKTLLDLGADVNYVDEQGWNAYFMACDQSNKKIASLLLCNGCEVRRDYEGNIPSSVINS